MAYPIIRSGQNYTYKQFNNVQTSDLQTQQDWINFFKNMQLLKRQAGNQKNNPDIEATYRKTIERIYPSYQMTSKARQASLKRTKSVWEYLKNSERFKKCLQEFDQSDITKKEQLTREFANLILQGCKPFHWKNNITIAIDVKNKGNKNIIGGGQCYYTYRLWSRGATEGYTSKNSITVSLYPHTQAIDIISTLYHEITHAMQHTVVEEMGSKKNNLKSYNPAYFDPEFTQILEASNPVYFQDVQGDLTTDASYLAYINQPAEQDARFGDVILYQLTKNYMEANELKSEPAAYVRGFPYLNQYTHFPYKNEESVLRAMGEPSASSIIKSYQNTSYYLSKYNAADTQQLKNAYFLKAVESTLTSLDLSRKLPNKYMNLAFNNLNTLLTSPQIKAHPKLQTALLNIYKNPPKTKAVEFLNCLNQGRQRFNLFQKSKSASSKTSPKGISSISERLKFSQQESSAFFEKKQTYLATLQPPMTEQETPNSTTVFNNERTA